MTSSSNQDGTAPVALDRDGVDRLIHILSRAGYQVIGPVARDGVIANEPITSVDDLPTGTGADQQAGSYSLTTVGDDLLFGFATTDQGWRRHLHPPRQTIFTASAREPHRARARTDHGDRTTDASRAAGRFESPIHLRVAAQPDERLALVGVRPCDLAAIGVLDNVMAGSGSNAFADQTYRTRRAHCFIVAVECGIPAATCFCASMGTGPGVSAIPDYAATADIVLTEVPGADSRDPVPASPGPTQIVGRAFTSAGREVIAAIGAPAANSALLLGAQQVVQRARQRVSRAVDQHGLRDLIYGSLDDRVWADTAERCLACSNCTMACPTCFCTSLIDSSSLDGREARREQVWDSCFNLDFSYVHGGSVRRSVGSRYRQWVSHKLAGWVDQFGHSGCVGCGRCITWCPAGIDLTELVATLRAGNAGPATSLATSLAESIGAPSPTRERGTA